MNTEEPKDGVIKFSYEIISDSPLEMSFIKELEGWRKILFSKKLIGEYPIEKVGYGNLSKRVKRNSTEFIITGSQTGKWPDLTQDQYSLILSCNLKNGSLIASGKAKPSSESLTHFAIYESNPNLNYIFHVHDKKMWEYMIAHQYDSTDETIAYGTEEMALASKRCIKNKTSGLFVMKGHEDGIISYGASAEGAGLPLIELHTKINS